MNFPCISSLCHGGSILDIHGHERMFYRRILRTFHRTPTKADKVVQQDQVLVSLGRVYHTTRTGLLKLRSATDELPAEDGIKPAIKGMPEGYQARLGIGSPNLANSPVSKVSCVGQGVPV